MSALYDWFEYPFLVRGFLCVLLLSPLLGGLSHLVVARRMAFFSAALGQAAITGVCVGLLLGEPLNAPYGGMFGFCLLSALAMVYAKRRSKLPPDTLIGVFLALTLGLGLCLLVAVTRQFNVHQVEAVLFGSLLTVTDTDLLLLVAAGIALAFLLLRHYNDLLLDSLSPPLATARGINSAYLEYGFAVVLDDRDSRQPEDDRRAPRRSARRGAGGCSQERGPRYARVSRVEHMWWRLPQVPEGSRFRRVCSCRPAAPSSSPPV